MGQAYIMRGVPGSGKSTEARRLAGENGVVHSTDDYRIQDGQHAYDPSQNAINHDKNFAAFCASLEAGVPVVVCDNINYRREHFQCYVDAAMAAGYTVQEVAMPHPLPELAARLNSHGASASYIQRVIDKWED